MSISVLGISAGVGRSKKFIDNLLKKTQSDKISWSQNLSEKERNETGIPLHLIVNDGSFRLSYNEATVFITEMYFNGYDGSNNDIGTWINFSVRLYASSSVLHLDDDLEDDLRILFLAIKEQSFTNEFNPQKLCNFIDSFIDDPS